ncbi:replication initiator [Nocardia sp. NPDC005746]|uniref:replication initiator n=1 Tax=Nocardia sp. NPDC005746 TaxID=3157062 RepID=UPI0033CF7182
MFSRLLVPAPNERTRRHYERLHAEFQRTPCSPQCSVGLRYGIVPRGAKAKTQPGRCKGRAHRRDTLGLRGRRVTEPGDVEVPPRETLIKSSVAQRAA